MDWENKVAKINVNQKESEKKLVLKFKSRKRNEYYWEKWAKEFCENKTGNKNGSYLTENNEWNQLLKKLCNVGKVT